MLPERLLNQIAEDVRLYFGDDNYKLLRAARQLLDAGWPREEILALLSDVYGAGRDNV
jgi:hypothetical protein